MSLTSEPWPMSNEAHLRWFIRPANDLLALSLIAIVIGAIGLIRRRPQRWRSNEAVMLAHLLCFLPTAIVFIGDPRYRTPYDVFALALVGAIVADRLGLDRATAQPDPVDRSGSISAPDGVQISTQNGEATV